jgi:hypothetical protein
MKAATVRTSIDIPRALHRKIREAAARNGCSARKLILSSLERVVEEPGAAQPRRRLRLERGLIRPAGRRIDLTNDQIYDLLEFP